MVDYREGNVLKVPGTSQVGEIKGDEILGSYARFTQFGLTLLGGSGTLEAGTLLKESATPGKYDGATDPAVDTIIGVLRNPVDTSDGDHLGNYVASGVIKLGALKLADGSAVAEGSYAAVATALNASIDSVHDYLIV